MKFREKLKCYRIPCLIVIALIFIAIIVIGLLSRDSAEKDVNKYFIDLTYHPESQSFEGKMRLEYQNNDTVSVKNIVLLLYPNAFSTPESTPFEQADMALAYPAGFSKGSISVTDIKINNKDADYSLSENGQQLFLLPESPIPVNGKCTVSLSFTLTVPHASGRFGYMGNTVNLGNWYPIAAVTENGMPILTDYTPVGDPFYSHVADYDINISTPYDYLVIASSPTEVSLHDGYAFWSTRSTNMRDFALVITKDIKCITDNSCGTTVNCYYTDNDTQAKNAVKAASDSIKLFEEIYGKYPYAQFNIVQTSFFIGGMEYPGMVLIDNSYFKTGNAHPLENVIVHECAHQWWYACAGNDQINNAWIDEGLATYSTMLYYERYKDEETYKLYYKYYITNGYRFHRESLQSKYGNVDQSLSRNLNDFENNEIYNMVCYEKSAMMLQSIREIVGDELFFSNIKQLYHNHINGIITPESFIRWMSKNTDKPVKELINSWINDKVFIP